MRKSAILLFALATAVAGPGVATAEPRRDLDRARELIDDGFRALEAADTATAEHRFELATRLSPDLAPAWLGLAECHRLQGDNLRALHAARKAAEAAPGLASASYAIARILVELGSPSAALDAAARARELDPGNVDIRLFEALLLQQEGRSAEASERLGDAWDADLRDPRLAEELALLLVASQQTERALEIVDASLNVAPARPVLQFAKALLLAEDIDRQGEAEDWFRRALAAGIREPGRVHLELGRLLVETGREQNAVEELERARELLPQSPEVQYHLATAHRALGDSEQAGLALQAFQRLNQETEASERRTRELGIALNEAQTLAQDNRLAESLKRVDEILASYPEEPQAFAIRAKVLFSMARRREALTAAVRARQLHPGRVEYHYLEGLFLMHSSRPAEAEVALLRALTVEEDSAEVHALLAGALVKQERPGEAVEHFQRALDLGREGADLRLGYAGALESLGRQQESESQMEAYRALPR